MWEDEEALAKLFDGVTPTSELPEPPTLTDFESIPGAVSDLNYEEISFIEGSYLPSFVDSYPIDRKTPKKVMDRTADEQSFGLRFRFHQHIAALKAADPIRFKSNFFVQFLCELSMKAAVFQNTQGMNVGTHSTPLFTRRRGIGASAKNLQLLYLDVDGTRYYSFYHINVYCHTCMAITLAMYSLIDMFLDDALTQKMFKSLLRLRRSEMKAVKDEVQKNVATFSSSNLLPQVSFPEGEPIYPGSVRMPTGITLTSESDFSKRVRHYFAKTLGTLDPKYDITSNSYKDLGYLEGVLEPTGFRRGGVAKSFFNANATNDVDFDKLRLHSHFFSVQTYSELLRDGMTKMGVPSFEEWYIRNLTEGEIISAISSSKSAGMGRVDFEYSYDPNSRTITVVKSGEKVNDIPEDLQWNGFTPGFSTTKKGGHAIYHMDEFIDLVSDPAPLYSAMSYESPGSVGTRYVAYKDPRLIFIVPLVIHLVVNSIARLLNRAIADRQDIYIYSQKGELMTDFSSLAALSSESFDHTVPISADWGNWDATVDVAKTSGIITAIRRVFGHSPTVQILVDCIFRSNFGVFTISDGGDVLIGQISRLASGDVLTSIRGSIENRSQIMALFYFVFGFDPGPEYSGLTPGTVIRYDLETEYAVARVSVVFRGLEVMGDDILYSLSFPGNEKVDAQARTCSDILSRLVDNAYRVGGEMNPTKQLGGPNLVVFVRQLRCNGVAVPRPSVSPIANERTNTTTIVQQFRILIARAAEWVVRGGTISKINNWLVGLWDASATETLPKKVDGLRWTKLDDRYLVHLSRAQLFAKSADGGAGMNPFGSQTGSNSGFMDFILWAVRSDVVLRIVKDDKYWTLADFDRFGYLDSLDDPLVVVPEEESNIDLSNSFVSIREKWRTNIYRKIPNQSAYEAACLVADRYVKHINFRHFAGDRMLDSIVSEMTRPVGAGMYRRFKLGNQHHLDWSNQFPNRVILAIHQSTNPTWLKHQFQLIDPPVLHFLNYHWNGSSPGLSLFDRFAALLRRMRIPRSIVEVAWSAIFVPYCAKRRLDEAVISDLLFAVTGALPEQDIPHEMLALGQVYGEEGPSSEFKFSDSISSLLPGQITVQDSRLVNVLALHLVS
jgi:hypothetical protein